MLFKNITTIDEKIQVRENMYVGVEGDTIDYIGETEPEKDYGEQYNGKGKLLMAGFVNAHAHSPMTLLRGYGENMALQDWLNKKIFPFEARLVGEDAYWGTLLAMAESIRYGIVSTTDMYYMTENMVNAVVESGAKANISRAITNMTGRDLFTMEEFYEEKNAVDMFDGAGDGRVKIDASLHAEYTSDPDTAMKLAQYAKQAGINMHVHVSETAFEHEECKRKYGMTPVAYLNSRGIFDTPTTAAHCVWIEGEDFDILKEKGVTVASNPISNMKLSSGVCNVPKLLEQGINVAIGTDSVASNNSLDFIEEIKTFAIASKEKYKDPTAVTPAQAIYAATFAGARSQGRWDCGKMETGCKADLIVIDISGPNMHPVHDLVTNLVYSACGKDVELTMVDGKVLYENGEYKTIDIEKVIYNVEKATARIVKELGSNELVARG